MRLQRKLHWAITGGPSLMVKASPVSVKPTQARAPPLTPPWLPSLNCALLLWLLLATANCTEARLPRLCLLTVEKKCKKELHKNAASQLWCGRRKTTGRDWEECWWGTNRSTLLLIRAIVSRPLCYGVKAARCCVVANTYPQLTAATRTEDRGPFAVSCKALPQCHISSLQVFVFYFLSRIPGG